MKKNLLYFLSFLVFSLVIIVIFIIAINVYVLGFSSINYYYNTDGLEKNYVGLVFGAAIIKNEIPTDILKDRLNVAYKAYKEGKIEKIIVSGATDIGYSEPDVMRNYLIDLGVDYYDIYVDYSGYDTYDSLYRAKEIFNLDNLVLFTQDFHLKRAMYISKKLGIDTYGVETNLQKYLKEKNFKRREIFARIKAFLDVDVFKSKSEELGKKIEIISDEKIEKAKKEILDK